MGVLEWQSCKVWVIPEDKFFFASPRYAINSLLFLQIPINVILNNQDTTGKVRNPIRNNNSKFTILLSSSSSRFTIPHNNQWTQANRPTLIQKIPKPKALSSPINQFEKDLFGKSFPY